MESSQDKQTVTDKDGYSRDEGRIFGYISGRAVSGTFIPPNIYVYWRMFGPRLIHSHVPTSILYRQTAPSGMAPSLACSARNTCKRENYSCFWFLFVACERERRRVVCARIHTPVYARIISTHTHTQTQARAHSRVPEPC